MTTFSIQPELRKKIENCEHLPTLPGVAAQLLQSSEVGLREMATIIARDPAMTARVLKFVNSSVYSFGKEIPTLRHAVMLLGENAVRTLALSFSLVRGLRRTDQSGFDYSHFWRRSILSAAAARALAAAKRLAEPEELFLAGLLQDIGMLVLQSAVPEEYGAIAEQADHDHVKLGKLEIQAFGVDHSEISAFMAHRWHLPLFFQTSLRGSHDPSRSEDAADPTVRCVYVSGLVADIWLAEKTQVAFQRAKVGARAVLALDESAFCDILSALKQSLGDLSSLFEVEVGDTEAIAQLLADAREQLVALNRDRPEPTVPIGMRLPSMALPRQHKDRAVRDPLTGVYNRSFFEETLPGEFESARRHGRPLSLVRLRVDNLKQLNDAHGHHAGDALLISIATRLEESLRSSDMVVRTSGDTFAVVLPDANAQAAHAVVNRILMAVAGTPHALDPDVAIEASISVGHATYDGDHRFDGGGELSAAAERALAASRRRGRNRVTSHAEATREPPASEEQAA